MSILEVGLMRALFALTFCLLAGTGFADTSLKSWCATSDGQALDTKELSRVSLSTPIHIQEFRVAQASGELGKRVSRTHGYHLSFYGLPAHSEWQKSQNSYARVKPVPKLLVDGPGLPHYLALLTFLSFGYFLQRR